MRLAKPAALAVGPAALAVLFHSLK